MRCLIRPPAASVSTILPHRGPAYLLLQIPTSQDVVLPPCYSSQAAAPLHPQLLAAMAEYGGCSPRMRKEASTVGIQVRSSCVGDGKLAEACTRSRETVTTQVFGK
jgi:hypothetical protein